MTQAATPTPPDTAAIRGRLEAATPGPWEREGNSVFSRPYFADQQWVAHKARVADAELIAHAPTDIEALLAENERLREAVRRLPGEHDSRHPDAPSDLVD